MVGSSSPRHLGVLQLASTDIEEEVMPNAAVDDIDLALLAALQADARAPIAVCLEPRRMRAWLGSGKPV
jgi:hypothetical protein